MTHLELFYPLKSYQLSQGFGGNANPSYHTENLIGHTGIDMVSFWDDNIMAAQIGRVYKVVNKDAANLMLYRAVFQLVDLDDGLISYEISYGHCHKIYAKIGSAKTGDLLASEGNTGDVYLGKHAVTEAEKESGSKIGTHLHFQLRALERVSTTLDLEVANGHYLTNDDGSLTKSPEGKFYHIVNFDNGFNGCVDPTPYFNGLTADVPQTLNDDQEIVTTIANNPVLTKQYKFDILAIILKVVNLIKNSIHG